MSINSSGGLTSTHGARGANFRRAVFFWLSILVMLNYAVLAFWYVGLDNFFSYAEPNIAAVSWTVITGQQMYHPLDSAWQYSMLYGPYLFVINALFLKLLGPGIASFKLAGALFAILSVLAVVWSVGRISNVRKGVMAGGFLALTYFSFWPFSTFIARADAPILGLVGLALVAANGRRRWCSIVVAAVALGVCVGIKPHTAMYFLPIWVILLQRFGWLAFLLAGFGSAPIAIAPFILARNISFENYILWLRVVSEHGLDFSLFIGNMRNMLFLQLLPAGLMLSILTRPMNILKQHRLFLGALAVSMAVTMPIASVTGAGKFHLAPLSISMVYWLAKVFHENYSTVPVQPGAIRTFALKHGVIYFLLLLMLLNAFPVNRRMVKLMNQDGRFNGATANIAEILEAYPGKTIGMGDGENKGATLTYFRALLVFAGQPYMLDAVNIMVRIKAGLGIGAETLAAIRSCRMDIWLIPKANTPFAIDSIYGGVRYLYPSEFRKAFLDHYQAKAQTGYYDLWFCKSVE